MCRYIVDADYPHFCVVPPRDYLLQPVKALKLRLPVIIGKVIIYQLLREKVNNFLVSQFKRRPYPHFLFFRRESACHACFQGEPGAVEFKVLNRRKIRQRTESELSTR